MAYEIEKDWITKSGLRAIVIIRKSGERRTNRWGYICVPPSHPLHGIGYSEQADCISQEAVDAEKLGKKSPLLALTATCRSDGEDKVRRSPDVAFDVHGGLTFSGGKGYPAEGWWLGFDCAHCYDGEIEPDPRWPSFGKVRELDYVENECESLAKQLAEIYEKTES